jgi:hypothetical protein
MKKSATAKRCWTASELRKLSPAERDAIMEEAAALAEADYRNNPELAAFEAYGKEDLHADSSGDRRSKRSVRYKVTRYSVLNTQYHS